MQMYFPQKVGGNAKTNILTSTSSKDTCPDTCPLKGKGCYARFGNVGRVWENVTTGKYSMNFADFLDRIRHLPRGSLWRHNQAGDLPGINNDIDTLVLGQIVSANKGKKGFTYTHKPLTKKNLKAIQSANQNGFTINISNETLTQVDTVMEMGLPAVVIVPVDSPKILKTPMGRSVLVCPQQRNKDTTCASCGLCQIKDRNYAIGFKVHGNANRMVEKAISEA